MSVLVAVVGLGLLVVVHEAGHFFTALAVGMRPRSFNLGFGPAFLKIRRGGVDYAIRLIPLGGYVKIPGMHRPAPSDVDLHFGPALRKTPGLVGSAERLKRALALEHREEALTELDALEQEGDEVGFGRAERRGVGELRDALGDDAYWRQSVWRKVAVILAGPGVNFLLAVVLFAVVLTSAGGKATTTVDEVLAGHPAAALGLRAGDRIVAIDHVPVRSGHRMISRIASSDGRPLLVTVVRDGRTVSLGPVAARKDGGVYRLGFRPRGTRLGVGEATWSSVKLTGVVSRETFKALAGIVHEKERKQLSSPVGIVRESAAQARNGWQSYLLVLGFISLSLALLNMLPLLPLDGGHIAFSIAEGIRGRALSREVYERASAIGLAFVLLLFFVGLSNDIGRLGGG